MTSHPVNDDGAQKRDKEDDEKGASPTPKRVEVDAWKEGCCHCAISGHQRGSLSQHGYVPLTSLKADPARRRRQVTFCQTFVPSHQNCMHCRKKSGHNSIKNSCVSSPVLFATEYPATPLGWYKMHSRQSNPDSRAQQETFHRVAQRGQGFQVVQVSQEVAVLRWDALERRQEKMEPDPRYADEVAPSFFSAASRSQPPMMSLGRERERQPRQLFTPLTVTSARSTRLARSGTSCPFTKHPPPNEASHSRHDCLSTAQNTFDAAHNLRRVAEYKLHRIAEGRE
ncbi:uncharacterized protein SEPMUDRAFT_121668 [Sphaerulina musiva SO2202]|uniref:Uncharacterized protein n=1 Tax=Sphaerulina musiva (strain SO2202) TaxID=692275 RepID=M3ARQ8_SPHMS|nr:uncharacterized protein SEPMUDRAFT_121668 [Sphaerulina musiva SO2202]EMF08179.1 hypothetical protein SEPMUDRAFT_121668 [Sphaerulina musiva SO2202]